MARRLTVTAGALALFIIASVAGCASTVDKSEIEQSSNPVAGMHSEVSKKVAAENNKAVWYSYEDALAKARKENRFVMVDFYATWCKWCKKFVEETIPDPEVAALLRSDFVCVRIDAESADKVVHEMRQMSMFELADSYGVQSYPTVWFLAPDGSRAKELKGYLGPSDFRDYLLYIKSGTYKKKEF